MFQNPSPIVSDSTLPTPLFRHKIPQLGVCTADGGSGLTRIDQVQRFFADPSAHCVGYDDRFSKNVAAMKVDAAAELALSGETELSAPTCSALLVSERERERNRPGKSCVASLSKVFGRATVVFLRTG